MTGAAALKDGPHAVTDRIIIEGGADYTPKIEEFKTNLGIQCVLAISGGADDGGPLSEQGAEAMIRDLLRPLIGLGIAIQTGGTKSGVPRIAAQVAAEYDFPTIGIFPALAANKHELQDGSLRLAVEVRSLYGSSAWGDEALIYTKVLDAVVVIGGNAGTLIEVAHLLKLNEKKADLLWREGQLLEELHRIEDLPHAQQDAVAVTRIRDGLKTVREELPHHKLRHIIPIQGTGGTADVVRFIPGKPKTLALAIPPRLITTGRAAAEYLRQAEIVPPERYVASTKDSTNG